ncbi:MAG TPA: CDP-alcohol phosphatidyltransferase family protein [bacterium]|nr:CDP-alcohol phosphatidyltransferase family protein [bacterium]
MPDYIASKQLILQSLRKQIAVMFGVNGLLLGAGAGLLQQYWGWVPAASWFGIAGVLLSYEWFEANRLLAQNRPPDKQNLLTDLGWGNRVTIIRGMLFAAAGGFLATPSPNDLWQWMAGLLYLLAVLSDRFDGYLARRSDHVTLMGGRLDMRLDALGILIATLLGLRFNQLPIWYLLVGSTFYLFTLGKWYRARKKKPVYPLLADPGRPMLAGLQMGFLSISLLPIFPPGVTKTAAIVFGIPLLVTFLRDWLIVSGRFPAIENRFGRQFRALQSYVRSGVLPFLRVVIVVCGLIVIAHRNDQWMPGVLARIANMGILVSEGALIGGLLLMIGAIGVGVLTRSVSLLLMAVMAGMLSTAVPPLLPTLLLIAAGILLHAGPGHFAPVQWDESLLFRNRT